MSYEEMSNTSDKEIWFLDSRCSNHMCGSKTTFSELVDTFRHVVKLEDNTKLNVLGKGNVKLCFNGLTHVITGVYYILDLKNNLLSLGQLQERNLSILIQA